MSDHHHLNQEIKMNYSNDFTRCERMGNTCPSKNHCSRYLVERKPDAVIGSLNSRREAGDTACVMFVGDLPSTFEVEND